MTRDLPQQKPRVETGPVKFGDDWTGLFIRGDNCFGYAMHLRLMIEHPGNAGISPLVMRDMEGLYKLLMESVER